MCCTAVFSLSAGHQLSKLPQATAQMLPLPAKHGGIWEQADQGEQLVTYTWVLTDTTILLQDPPLTSLQDPPDLISSPPLTSFPLP